MTELRYDKGLRVARASKRKRTGVCRVCGAETRYSGKKGKPVSDLCQKCARIELAERQMAKRGLGPRQQEVLAFMDGQPRRFSEIAKALDMSAGTVAVLLNRLIRYGLVERVSRGVYRRLP